MILLHENSRGIKIIREDMVKRSVIKVLRPDGTASRTYRMNNIPFYSHPLLSWANLDCCDGWAFDKEYLFTAVQSGKKPVADIDDTVLPEITPTDNFDVWYDTKVTRNGPYVLHHMLIARKCSLADLYDLDEIVEAYKKQDVSVYKLGLESFFYTELITAGLGLGYPIETTASILNGH